MTDLQKALVVSFSGTLIGLENPNFDSIWDIVKKKIGLSSNEFDKYAENIEFLIGNMGILAFNSFSGLPYSDKNKVKEILKYALDNGNVKHIPQVHSLYNGVLSFLN